MIMCMGEITTSAYVDIPSIVRNVVTDIGYDRAKYGFDGNTCAVTPAPAPAPAQAPLATNAELIDVLQLANRLKDETVAAARQKAEEILAEADKQAKERLGAVAVERETLTKEVETLRTNVKNYRERFTAMLREQQEALDRLTL